MSWVFSLPYACACAYAYACAYALVKTNPKEVPYAAHSDAENVGVKHLNLKTNILQ